MRQKPFFSWLREIFDAETVTCKAHPDALALPLTVAQSIWSKKYDSEFDRQQDASCATRETDCWFWKVQHLAL